MSLSIETILADARKLVVRLKEHDTTADCLIARTQSLHKQFDAMKQVKSSIISSGLSCDIKCYFGNVFIVYIILVISCICS